MPLLHSAELFVSTGINKSSSENCTVIICGCLNYFKKYGYSLTAFKLHTYYRTKCDWCPFPELVFSARLVTCRPSSMVLLMDTSHSLLWISVLK